MQSNISRSFALIVLCCFLAGCYALPPAPQVPPDKELPKQNRGY